MVAGILLEFFSLPPCPPVGSLQELFQPEKVYLVLYIIKVMIQPIKKPRIKLRGAGVRKWRRFREAFLKSRVLWNGLYECEWCLIQVPNPDLDHIKKRSTNPELCYEPSNIRILCRNCHLKRHQ